jgi:hypothetical protein
MTRSSSSARAQKSPDPPEEFPFNLAGASVDDIQEEKR